MGEKVLRAIIVGHNADVENFGCRATSHALEAAIKNSGYSISYRFNWNDSVTGLGASIFERLAAKNRFTNKFSSYLKREISQKSVVSKILFKEVKIHEVNKNYIRKSSSSSNHKLRRVIEEIKNTDVVFINGEGSGIFKSGARRDFLTHMIILKIARLLGKDTFYVNAMIDFWDTSYLDYEEYWGELHYCRQVFVRDMASLDRCRDELSIENIKFVPDALFSMDINKLQISLQDLLSMGFKTEFNNIDLLNLEFFDLCSGYVIVSGTSDFSATLEKSSVYEEIITHLLARNENIVLLNSGSDNELLGLAREYRLPYFDSSIGLFTLANLIGNASYFISGRYHPSIIAACLGTPFISLSSNSHKNTELRKLLKLVDASELSLKKFDISELNSKIENLCNEKLCNEVVVRCGELRSEMINAYNDLGSLHV